jgi:hypothetical protein
VTALAVKLLTCREADRIYRLRSGTARKAFHARKINGRRTNKAIYISAKRAEEIWGLP